MVATYMHKQLLLSLTMHNYRFRKVICCLCHNSMKVATSPGTFLLHMACYLIQKHSVTS